VARVDRHLVRAQHEVKVEDLDNCALLEMRVTMTLRTRAELGLDENVAAVGELCDAMLDQLEREQEETVSPLRADARARRSWDSC